MTLIVAVDRVLDETLVGELCRVAAGVKVGLPAVLRGGLSWAFKVADSCKGLRILDFKLADVEHVMRSIVEPFLGHYDAFIAHSFVGARGALQGLRELLDSVGARLLLVASMSHEGSREVYDRAASWIDEVIREVDPWGLVAPATRPEVIARLRREHPGRVILSPGVGAQGARPGEALCAGADYEIVGRAVFSASDPVEAAELVRREQADAVRGCGRAW